MWKQQAAKLTLNGKTLRISLTAYFCKCFLLWKPRSMELQRYLRFINKWCWSEAENIDFTINILFTIKYVGSGLPESMQTRWKQEGGWWMTINIKKKLTRYPCCSIIIYNKARCGPKFRSDTFRLYQLWNKPWLMNLTMGEGKIDKWPLTWYLCQQCYHLQQKSRPRPNS